MKRLIKSAKGNITPAGKGPWLVSEVEPASVRNTIKSTYPEGSSIFYKGQFENSEGNRAYKYQIDDGHDTFTVFTYQLPNGLYTLADSF